MFTRILATYSVQIQGNAYTITKLSDSVAEDSYAMREADAVLWKPRLEEPVRVLISTRLLKVIAGPMGASHATYYLGTAYRRLYHALQVIQPDVNMRLANAKTSRSKSAAERNVRIALDLTQLASQR
jgi:hypothetical protein